MLKSFFRLILDFAAANPQASSAAKVEPTQTKAPGVENKRQRDIELVVSIDPETMLRIADR